LWGGRADGALRDSLEDPRLKLFDGSSLDLVLFGVILEDRPMRLYCRLASVVRCSADGACLFITSSGAGVVVNGKACELRVCEDQFSF
jgi:hypothetical protein